MEYIIEQIPVQPMVYMRRTGAYGPENYKLMAAMKEWAHQKGLLEGGTIFGIAHDQENTPPEKCRYDVCLVASVDIPADEAVQRGQINGGKYAIFTVPHTAEAIQEFWASVFKIGFPFDTTKSVLERYTYRMVEDGKCEFCIPLLS